MSKTAAQRTRDGQDPWRAKVVAWVTDHPGATTGDVTRAFAPMPRTRTHALLSSAADRGELVRRRGRHGEGHYSPPPDQ